MDPARVSNGTNVISSFSFYSDILERKTPMNRIMFTLLLSGVFAVGNNLEAAGHGSKEQTQHSHIQAAKTSMPQSLPIDSSLHANKSSCAQNSQKQKAAIKLDLQSSERTGRVQLTLQAVSEQDYDNLVLRLALPEEVTLLEGELEVHHESVKEGDELQIVIVALIPEKGHHLIEGGAFVRTENGGLGRGKRLWLGEQRGEIGKRHVLSNGTKLRVVRVNPIRTPH